MRGAQSKHGVGQEVKLLEGQSGPGRSSAWLLGAYAMGILGNLSPYSFASNWKTGIRVKKEVVEEMQVGHGKLRL